MPPTDKLTDSLIRNAKPGQRPVQRAESGKQTSGARKARRSAETIDKKNPPEKKSYRLWDGGGLYLEVDLAGGKWWRWKYRFQGKEKRLSLGVYPEVSLATAREQRRECRRLLAQGTDPAEHRKAVKSAREGATEDSFEVIAREWLKKFIDPMSESHRTRVYARFVNDIFPAIGRRPIAEITPNELLNVILKIEERGAKDTAHRTLGSCSQVFRYAVSSKRCQNNIRKRPELAGSGGWWRPSRGDASSERFGSRPCTHAVTTESCASHPGRQSRPG